MLERDGDRKNKKATLDHLICIFIPWIAFPSLLSIFISSDLISFHFSSRQFSSHLFLSSSLLLSSNLHLISTDLFSPIPILILKSSHFYSSHLMPSHLIRISAIEIPWGGGFGTFDVWGVEWAAATGVDEFEYDTVSFDGIGVLGAWGPITNIIEN